MTDSIKQVTRDETHAENILQPVMNRAYDKWTDQSWDFDDFLTSLDVNERDVVAIGKLNQPSTAWLDHAQPPCRRPPQYSELYSKKLL